jgi:hypothetical protein
MHWIYTVPQGSIFWSKTDIYGGRRPPPPAARGQEQHTHGLLAGPAGHTAHQEI